MHREDGSNPSGDNDDATHSQHPRTTLESIRLGATFQYLSRATLRRAPVSPPYFADMRESPRVRRNTRWTCRARLVEPQHVFGSHSASARIDEVKALRWLALRGYKLACVFAARFGAPRHEYPATIRDLKLRYVVVVA
jgi:hypothetical protein